MQFKYFISIFLFVVLVSCSEDPVTEFVEPLDDYSDIINEPINNKDIENVINGISKDSLTSYLRILTGLDPFISNNDTSYIKTRNLNFDGNDKAADFIENKLSSLGLSVTNQLFNAKGRNVYATINGSIFPNEYYIICAHYDTMPVEEVAPGADDNGSGVAAVIEAARLLSKYQPKYSVIFAVWDEEEVGLIGSHRFSDFALFNQMKIRGVINIDMIGWDGNFDNIASLIVKEDNRENELLISVLKVNEFYNIGIEFYIYTSNRRSDHYSFWQNGFNAVSIIEDFDDFNNFYHSSNDTIDLLNMNYMTRCVKVAIGTLSLLSF